MLEHLNQTTIRPKRVVVIGAAGFVGGAIARRMARDGVPVFGLSRKEVDLLQPDAAQKLRSFLKAEDAVVAASARAPVKNPDMLVENMIMARAMVRALAGAPVSHVINISSDAIYADSDSPLTEESIAAPASLHGAMHLARELMFLAEVKAPLAMLRPSLLYGAGDPHNGYGPNRFRRQAMKGETITLFGEGEERRDHVFIDDVAELAALVLYRRSTGALNIACGEARSFMDIALLASRISGKGVEIKGSPRSGPMPHNGYRPFDVTAVTRAFPSFRFTPFEDAYARSFKGADHG
jgi:nucleoside-diphosphate-sugar epimerase